MVESGRQKQEDALMAPKDVCEALILVTAIRPDWFHHRRNSPITRSNRVFVCHATKKTSSEKSKSGFLPAKPPCA